MRYHRYEITARAENFEQYEMSIVAKTAAEADEIAHLLCVDLDLILMGCYRSEDSFNPQQFMRLENQGRNDCQGQSLTEHTRQ